MTGLRLDLDADALRPLIRLIAAEVLAQLDCQRGRDDRLAYSESEAAALLGLQTHQLRDQRLQGRLSYSRGPKGCVLYSRRDLLEYLADRREEARG